MFSVVAFLFIGPAPFLHLVALEPSLTAQFVILFSAVVCLGLGFAFVFVPTLPYMTATLLALSVVSQTPVLPKKEISTKILTV
jgi:hypothetical protein